MKNRAAHLRQPRGSIRQNGFGLLYVLPIVIILGVIVIGGIRLFHHAPAQTQREVPAFGKQHD